MPQFWRIFDYGVLHLEDDDMEVLMMEAWLWWWFGCFDWWHGGFALMMTWCFGWWRLCLVGDLVDGGFATLMIWRQFLFYILPASSSLPPLRVAFLKPLLVGSKRIEAGSCTRVGALIFSWNWENLRRLKSFAAHCIKWFLSIYYWVFHSYLVSIFSVIDLLLWCFNDQ